MVVQFIWVIWLRISFKEKEATSYARSFGEKAVLLDVVKRGGKNLIMASQDIKKIIGALKISRYRITKRS